MDLNELAKEIHADNAEWWHCLETGERLERNRGELLSLVISEISECLEGERKDLMDDKLPHRKMAEVEMADTFIRTLDYCAGFGIKIIEEPCATLPKNKGEALFKMTKTVVLMDSASSHGFLIAQIRAYCDMHGYNLDEAVRRKEHLTLPVKTTHTKPGKRKAERNFNQQYE